MIAGFAALTTWPTDAATFTYANIGDFTVLTLHGEIVEGDAQRLSDTISWVDQTFHRKVRVLDLDSPGGNIGESFKVADMVAGKAGTTVIDGATCASACVTILLAGAPRIVGPQTRIGVHSGADLVTHTETISTEAGTLELARFYSKLGVPASIIGKMVATPASDIYWLTLDEKKQIFDVDDRPTEPAAPSTAFTPPQPTSPAQAQPNVLPKQAAPAALPQGDVADCLVIGAGKTIIDGTCVMSNLPQNNGSFRLTSENNRVLLSRYGHSNTAAGFVNTPATGLWNLGTLSKSGPCWVNVRWTNTRICAWKLGEPRWFGNR